MLRIALATGIFALCVAPTVAETRTFCIVDHGTKTCHSISGKSKTVKIMGISAKKYERGVRAGKCMPSPAGTGVCGGG